MHLYREFNYSQFLLLSKFIKTSFSVVRCIYNSHRRRLKYFFNLLSWIVRISNKNPSMFPVKGSSLQVFPFILCSVFSLHFSTELTSRSSPLKTPLKIPGHCLSKLSFLWFFLVNCQKRAQLFLISFSCSVNSCSIFPSVLHLQFCQTSRVW